MQLVCCTPISLHQQDSKRHVAVAGVPVVELRNALLILGQVLLEEVLLVQTESVAGTCQPVALFVP